jgi:hypothetical protein
MSMAELRMTLRFVADWDRIELVRRAVCDSADAVFADEQFRDAIGMIASELLENAVKYGAADAPIEVSVIRAFCDGGTDVVEVVVTNEAQDTSPNLDVLRERLAWLGTFEDPVQAYQAALLSAANNEIEGGLGLVRVAYEGRATLACEVAQGRRVRVTATCPTPPWEPWEETRASV